MPPLLEIANLTVEFSTRSANRVVAVDGVTLSLNAGEAVGVLGESGCGKSTLATALLRLLPDTGRIVQGSIMFRGRDLRRLSESEMRSVRGSGIAMVYQEPGLSLNPVIRVGDQIAEVIRAHAPASRGAWREQAENALTQVRLKEPARIYAAYPHQLSGGEQQRIALARALACRPALLIADEPTSLLDATTENEILDLIGYIRRSLGVALLFITHNPAVLVGIAERVVVMYAGQIVEDGTLAEISTHPLHPYTAALFQCVPPRRQDESRQKLTAIPGGPPDAACLPAGCRFEPRCSERMQVCTEDQPPQQIIAGQRVRCFKYVN